VRLPLKVATLRTGKSQREISLDARIPETRLSDLVRGRAWPSSTERAALTAALGQDYFAGEQNTAAEGSSRR
jgi:hypothetical protein